MQKLKIIVLGDSIAAGLGVKDQCYADLLRAALERADQKVKLINLAYTAFQITDSQKLLPQVATEKPDIVILAHGITEAIIRPMPTAMRLVPRRWRPIGWLDPRPYYSRRPSKRLGQQIESAVRWRYKALLIRRFGGETLLAISDFERQLADTLEWLLQKTTTQIILVTHNGIDEHYYPGSEASLGQYEQCLKNACLYPRIDACDVSQLLTRWSDYFADHFHPSASGHAKIAAALQKKITL